MSKTEQQYKPFSVKRTSHRQRIHAKWDEVRAKSADENFNYVPIADYFVPVSFIAAVKRSVLDITKFDPRIGAENFVEEMFWQSLDDGMRSLVGPTIAFIQEHDEWFEYLRLEIAYRASQLGGKHDQAH